MVATRRLKDATDLSNPAAGYGDVVARRSLGERLRRCAQRATISNPCINPPLTIPPVWAISTAYTVGSVVTNGGNQYLCLIAGTSAGSGGPTGTHTRAIDNTIEWEFYGVSPIAANDVYAPTVTLQTTFPTGLTAVLSPSTDQAKMRLRGATWVGATVSGSAYLPKTFDNKPSSGAALVNFRLPLDTDAPKLAFAFGNGGGYFRLIIDGRYYSYQHFKTNSGANPNYAVIDFTAVGGRKRRRIEIEGGVNGAVNININIAPIYATAIDRFWQATAPDEVTAVWIGDSLGEGSGYGPALAGNNMPMRFAKQLGISDLWNLSKGGTGYINKGVGSAFYTYRERVPQALVINPDLFLLDGSTNDTSSSAAAVTAEALLTLQTIRAGSAKPIVVFGLWSVNIANLATTEAAVAAAVTAFNDPLTFFCPQYANADGPIITGTGNNSGQNGSGNADFYLGGDALHPIELGAEYNSDRKAADFRRYVLPYLS